MKKIERKTIMATAVLALAVLSGIALMAYANGATNNTSTTTSNTTWNFNDQNNNGTMPFFGGRVAFGRGRGGCGGFGQVTVTQEYRDNVINITKSDSDVQQLLTDGYNITTVRPIISTTVEADGTVTMKATAAIVTLLKDTTGRAIVWVDVEQAKVTRIEILTRTVIEKP